MQQKTKRLYKRIVSVVCAMAMVLTGLLGDIGTMAVKADTKPTLWLVGDSTVCSFTDSYYYPRYGYGTQIENYLDGTYTVQNLALSGRSSKSYLSDPEYQTLKTGIKPGDALIIGFGHNDEKDDEPARYTDPTGSYTTEGSFAYYLYTYYVKVAKDAGAEAILCTPICRRNASADTVSGSLAHVTSQGDYPQAIRDLGAAVSVPVVDLTAMTKTLYEKIGAAETLYLHAWTSDNPTSVDKTHLNIYGAKKVAYMLAAELQKTSASIAAHVSLAAGEPTKEKDLVSNPEYVHKDYSNDFTDSTKWKAYQEKFKGTVFGDVGGESKITSGYFTLETDADGNMHMAANGQGKLAAAGVGIAMYYYRVPVDSQFSISAKATVNSVTVNATKDDSKQIGFGLMARDDMYIDTSTAGIASDYVAAGSTAAGVNCFRQKDGALTFGSSVNAIQAGDVYKLNIISNSDGYACTFGDNTQQSGGYDYQLTSIDSEYVYVGMFVARNIDVTYSDIVLKVDGQTILDTREPVTLEDVTACGYAEGAYAEWPLLDEVDGYEVYVSQDQDDDDSWVKLDNELVRKYVDGSDAYMRADALGLTPGIWYMKIVASTYNSAQEKVKILAQTVKSVEVTAHDRSGFAWVNGTASGAYNENGSLKNNALVIYLTEANKDKVTATLAGVSATGIQNILKIYTTEKVEVPLDIRVIGNITDPAILTDGDLRLASKVTNNAGITIEGVGKDAVFNGFGLVLEDASNVEVRNLGVMLCDSNEGDSISLTEGNDHIWVHNCDLFYGDTGSDADQKKGDGALDCKKSDYITFSYNHFWDCGKCCLLGLEEGFKEETNVEYHITYHHNWFDHSDSRHPRVRYYTAHVYNNYYDGNYDFGIGVTCGSSVFAENNYFRNVKYPMKSSQQGSDKLNGFSFEATKKNEDGTTKYEDGGIIKAYGNIMEGTRLKSFINGNTNDGDDAADDTSFDAYVVKNREDEIPATIVTLVGGHTYNNFDTATDFYEYSVTPTADVPDFVEANAGRVGGGDFKWTFVDADADDTKDLDKYLKTALQQYQTKLAFIGGILGASEKSYVTVTVDPGNGTATKEVRTELNQPMTAPATPTVIPAGKVEFGYWYEGSKENVKWDFATDIVKGDMTLNAKWYTQEEADAAKNGGTPIGIETVKYSMLDRGTRFDTEGIIIGSPYFEITGEMKKENGGASGTYVTETGAEWKVGAARYSRLTFSGSASVKFTTTTESALVVVLLERSYTTTPVLVDGTSVAAADAVVQTTVAAGNHSITPAKGVGTYYLKGIMVVPGKTCTMTFDSNGGTPVDSVVVERGNALAEPAAPTKEGYTLEGWYTDAALTNKYDFTKAVTAATGFTLYANWTLNTYDITFESNGGSEVAKATVNHGDKLTAPTAPTREGYTFENWYTDEALTTKYDFTQAVTAAFKLYAKWNPIPEPAVFTITFESNGGSAVAAVEVKEGGVLAKPANPTRIGYTFDGWYSNQELATTYNFNQKVTAAFTLYAKWTKLPDPDDVDPETLTGFKVTLENAEEGYTYTGSAIKPKIKVTNNEVALTEGVNYTVKYSNNVNASANSEKQPTITVTGKGNFGGKETVYFEIKQKSIEDSDVNKTDSITTTAAAIDKAVPVIDYNGKKLKLNKDFQMSREEDELQITGIGNYTGTITVALDIKESKSEIRKFKVKVLKSEEPLVYDGTEKYVDVLVTDTKDKEIEPSEGTDYDVFYSNNRDAGTAKVTVVGKGDYAGTVTKSYKIKPCRLTAYIAGPDEETEYSFVSGGVRIDEDIMVGADEASDLELGRDYKLSYSGNKKVGRASFKVTFLGNYKGSKPVKGYFMIKEAGLENAKVLVPDKVYTGKPGTYTSAPLVSVNGVMLKKSDYSCSYYYDAACTDPVSKENPVALNEGDDSVTIYVKIEGKKNYAGSETVADYTVAAASYTDLSKKAKVTVTDAYGAKLSKAAYTGAPIKPTVSVTLGGVPLTEDVDYTVSYIGNVNKGKATVLITGKGAYAGTKTASFKIVAGKVSDLVKEESTAEE